MKRTLWAPLISLAALLGAVTPAAAQWQTQSLTIKPGWTAVYLFVDASYSSLDTLVGSDPSNPIAEVWMWMPPTTAAQYINNPLAPFTGGSQWANWERLNTGQPSTFSSLAPNCAYLIHSVATTNYTWRLQGRPVAPVYTWSASSINLVGFPTAPNRTPRLDTFLGLAPTFQSVATVYQYVGGDLSANNPMLVFAPHAVTVDRGRAFWINETNFVNSFFGPFQVVSGGGGAAFGASFGSASFRLVNTTPATITVNLTLQPSETPPAGQAAIAGVPPVILRGALNASNVTYGVTSLSAATPVSWTLAPAGQAGSDVPVVLGVDRTQLTDTMGKLYAGILRFTDSAGYTEVNLPTSAQGCAYTGLWVGAAAVSQASAYLKMYQTNADGTLAQNPTNGAYVVTRLNTNLGATAATFPLRLILHSDGTNVNLLQRVFCGADANSNAIIATAESCLDPNQLSSARRISSVEFPWTAGNQLWKFNGQLAPSGWLTNTITVAYDDQASNPFLHTFHPDHDNLDATFTKQLPIGSESYQIDRQITMQLIPPGSDFLSLTQYGQTFTGAYAEAITLTGVGYATRTFNVAGAFALKRLSPIAKLTQPR